MMRDEVSPQGSVDAAITSPDVSKASSDEEQQSWHRVRLQQLFYEAVAHDDLETVLECLRRGADLRHTFSPNSQTALHEGASRGLVRVCELLLRAGADVNVVDGHGFLALHYAAQNGHFHTVRCLVLYGSMVTVENEYGDAPIHTATRYGHSEVLPLLLSVDLRRDFGRGQVPPQIEGQEHLNLQNANGDTPLHIAAALNRKTIVKRLLQWGANPHILNAQGLIPLNLAIEKQHPGCVKLLRFPPPVVLFVGPKQLQLEQAESHLRHQLASPLRYIDNNNNFASLPIRNNRSRRMQNTVTNGSSEAISSPSIKETHSLPGTNGSVQAKRSSGEVEVPILTGRSASMHFHVNNKRQQSRLHQAKVLNNINDNDNIRINYNNNNGLNNNNGFNNSNSNNGNNGDQVDHHRSVVTIKAAPDPNKDLERRLGTLSNDFDARLRLLSSQYAELQRREETLRRAVMDNMERKEEEKGKTKQRIRIVLKDNKDQTDETDNKEETVTKSTMTEKPAELANKFTSTRPVVNQKESSYMRNSTNYNATNTLIRNYKSTTNDFNRRDIKIDNKDDHINNIKIDNKESVGSPATTDTATTVEFNRSISETIVGEDKVVVVETMADPEGTDVRVTGVNKDGKTIIYRAPRLKDLKGRTSPRIRELQEQLRQSQLEEVKEDSNNYDDYGLI